jgi:hypothetical protein
MRTLNLRPVTLGSALPFLLVIALAGCAKPAPPAAAPATSAASAPQAQPGAYIPGLGEIMSLQQMRHAKLWLAGSAGNWPLAAYELDELREGFDDVVHFHPTHKDAPLPLNQLVPKIVGQPLKDLDAAIAGKDRERFAAAFDALTAGCNSCHQATNFGFNVVVRPAGNPYLNQSFAPPAK